MTTAPPSLPLDADMVAMLRTSLRHVLTESTSVPFAERLNELGWADVVTQDQPTALGLLFEVKGDTLSTVDALGPILSARLATLTGDHPLAYAAVGLMSPFGAHSWNGHQLSVDTAVTSPPGASLAVVVDGRLAIVATADLTVEALAGTDEPLGVHRLSGTVDAAAIRWIDGGVADELVALGRWLISCELVGIGHHVLASAVEYTKARVQYGKPIGVFQALQHRLASAHALVIGASRLATQAGIDGDEWTALTTKAMAGQAAEYACTQAQQCYGAIGFTWEHEFHRYLRRTYLLDRLLGDWRSLEHEIGSRLQATGVVPRISSI